jgi:hypothetical protein
MRHTIDEAASLVGRTRRSLYRAMNESRLVYGVGHDDRRYIDTTELLRVYGPFVAPSQDVTPEMSHGVTVPDDFGEIIAKAVAKAVAEAVEPLRQEIEKLRLENAEQRLIEHKPGSVLKNEESQPAMQDGMPEKPQSFADLLAGLK